MGRPEIRLKPIMNTSMSTWMSIRLVLLTLFIGASLSHDLPDVLTGMPVDRQIRIFGTNSSANLPTVEVAQIELIDQEAIKPFRKRLPPNVVQYRANINGEVLILSLRQNLNFIAPGCLLHKYDRDGNKTLAPCFGLSRHCYYTGRSMNHNDSWVAASVCGGLRGTVVYDNTTFIISPLNDTDPQDFKHVIDHVVYKYQGDKQKCSTTHPNGRVLYPSQSRQRRDTRRNDIPRHSRQRRDVRRRYMKIGVVIDPTMVRFHGTDLNEYTATALNIASRLYANQNTGQDIDLVITSIYKFESYESFNITRTSDAGKLLNDFCKWKSIMSMNEDATILLTRDDLAYNGMQWTTGLANPSGMCSATTGCAVIHDNGPAMGYTIAHEIGHLLSMTHDGPYGDTTCGSSIMNVHGVSGSAASTWSSCSKAALANFLRSDKSKCLLNKPRGYDDHQEHYLNQRDIPLPGVLYTADEQCQFMLGPGASACSNNTRFPWQGKNTVLNNTCEEIACITNDGCYFYSAPLLDGTDINNTRTWCVRGEPMAMTDTDNTPPINGGWSEWSAEWSTCTQTCGGGVKIRWRTCNDPIPQFQGNLCPGSDVDAVLCNIQQCGQAKTENECREQSNSYTHTCSNDDDGVDCWLNSSAPFTKCIHGICREFGCDGHLDSGLMFDNCGRCNGTGSGCVTIKGTYNRNDTAKVYETVLVLPKGTAGITINQTNGYCFLNAEIGGCKVFKEGGPAFTGVYMHNGVHIHYIRDLTGNYTELIRIMQPLPEEVKIQVYRQYDYTIYVGVTPVIYYQYNEMKYSRSPNLYTWSTTHKRCNKECGKGLTVPEVKCWSLTGPVEDIYCDIFSKPQEIPQICNDFFCPPRWDVSDWGECSVTCGNGTRNRTVECIQEKTDIRKVVPDTQCSSSSRPDELHDCNMGYCQGTWRQGDCTKCSRTCGNGIIECDVYCSDNHDNAIRLPEDRCNATLWPGNRSICRLEPCRLDIVGPNCTNIRNDCEGYGPLICGGEYQDWAEINCMKHCRICDACEDDPFCKDHISDHGDEACANFPDYMRIKCRRSCKYCSDINNDVCDDVEKSCHLYQKELCTDLSFGQWMTKNCQKYCDLC